MDLETLEAFGMDPNEYTRAVERPEEFLAEYIGLMAVQVEAGHEDGRRMSLQESDRYDDLFNVLAEIVRHESFSFVTDFVCIGLALCKTDRDLAFLPLAPPKISCRSGSRKAGTYKTSRRFELRRKQASRYATPCGKA